jgi:murein DD-endopeptidase MepM/ murein hydrolase activator NlpD
MIRYTWDNFMSSIHPFSTHFYLTSAVLFLMAVAAAACQPLAPSSQAGPVETVEAVVIATLSPVPNLEVGKEEPASPTATVVAPTSSPAVTYEPEPLEPAAGPTQELVSNRVCSPLEGHSLFELEEIISFPYDPPPLGKDTGHHGVDFAYYRWKDRLSIQGVIIQAALPGRVAAVILNRPPYGYMVMVETPPADLPIGLADRIGVQKEESVYLLYAHMNDVPVVVLGEMVGCGQALGEVGNTPPEWSSAPHLHFEGRVGPEGTVFAEMAYYINNVTNLEYENYNLWRMSGVFRLFDPMILVEYGVFLDAEPD